ncbi:hypothetical protein CDD83_9666 [Cordyceps sp. RAO-2017]|nr:hypothetical protein CDD83_9666 [Cordyceps sp. RAO-2017]
MRWPSAQRRAGDWTALFCFRRRGTARLHMVPKHGAPLICAARRARSRPRAESAAGPHHRALPERDETRRRPYQRASRKSPLPVLPPQPCPPKPPLARARHPSALSDPVPRLASPPGGANPGCRAIYNTTLTHADSLPHLVGVAVDPNGHEVVTVDRGGRWSSATPPSPGNHMEQRQVNGRARRNAPSRFTKTAGV